MVKYTNINNLYNIPISIEQRQNNSKRDFLFVNEWQCKYLPASPIKTQHMCQELANRVNIHLTDYDTVLVIGFCETATAITELVAQQLKGIKFIVCTTRHEIDAPLFVSFEEEHSAYTHHNFYVRDCGGFISYLRGVTTILFIDDEITTGKTIFNLYTELKQYLISGTHCYVASVCNWMTPELIDTFAQQNIFFEWLVHGQLRETDSHITKVIRDTLTTKGSVTYTLYRCSKNLLKWQILGHTSQIDIVKEIACLDDLLRYQSLRIIGTEECMWPAIQLGCYLESLGKKVLCHSTARTAINVTGKAIQCVETLRTPYDDSNHETYIYNINEETDVAVLLSDASFTSDHFSTFYQTLAHILYNYCSHLFIICLGD